MFERYIETEDFLAIPESKYFININGVVKDSLDNILPIGNNEYGDSIVHIDWIYGYRSYIVSVLLAFTFKPTNVPIEFWGKLNILFKDGNRMNNHPANIVWKFPIGLGSRKYHGYAFIPMYSKYLINRQGRIRNIDSFTNLPIRSVFSDEEVLGKYKQHTLKPDIGVATTLCRHRALCLAWKDYPVNVDDLVPNHINGIKGDDRLSNLEWSTNGENIIHAIRNNLIRPGINSGKKVPVLVRDVRTGTVSEYTTIVAVATALSLTKDAVQWRLKFGNQLLFPEGKQYKRADDETPWYEPDDYEKELLAASWVNPVLTRDVITGEVVEYSTQRKCAAALGISESTLFNWLTKLNQPIMPGLIQVKLKEDPATWRIPDNPEDEIDNIGCTKPILVKNIKTGVVLEFPSVTECGKHLGIKNSTLCERLKSNGQRVYSGYLLFKYKSVPTSWFELEQES